MTKSFVIAAVALVAATAAFGTSAGIAADTAPTTTTTSAAPSDAECAHADALASAGETAAAEKIYISLAAKEGTPCALDALAELNGDTSGDRLIADVTRALKLIGSAAVVLLLVVLALVLLYVVLTWIRPVRAVMSRTLLIGRLFDPTLKVEPFSDAGARPPVGTGVTGLVRAALARPGTEQEEIQQLRVDSNAGVETIASAIGGLGELAPQAKGIASLMTSLPAMADTPRYSVSGTLQLASEAGADRACRRRPAFWSGGRDSATIPLLSLLDAFSEPLQGR